MDSRETLARLTRRSAEGAIRAEAFVRLLAGAAYPLAARTLASNMLALAGKDRGLDGIFKDAGRYAAAMWAIYSHFTGGLTLPRLKELCVSSGLVSPGRARSLLLYLRYLGYVELLPARTSGQAARYIPTAEFLRAWRVHLQAALDAVSVVEPRVRILREGLGNPELFQSFSRELAAGLLESAHSMDREAPYVRVFLHRNAGAQIMQMLIVADPTDTFPPSNPIPFSLAATARKFGVSRIQVRRVLDAAAQASLLRFHNERTVVLEESGREACDRLYRSQLIRLLMAAAATATEAECLPRQTPPQTRDHNRLAGGSRVAAELTVP